MPPVRSDPAASTGPAFSTVRRITVSAADGTATAGRTARTRSTAVTAVPTAAREIWTEPSVTTGTTGTGVTAGTTVAIES